VVLSVGITVTMNGSEDAKSVSEEILSKIETVATEALRNAGAFHIDTAINNIKTAYTEKDYPLVSLIYARWVVRNILYPGVDMSSDENEKLAKQFRASHTSMILTGDLLNNLHTGDVVMDDNTITIDLRSDSTHSLDLETGFLFGQYRMNRRRRFFTGHLFNTIDKMRDDFMDGIRRMSEVG